MSNLLKDNIVRIAKAKRISIRKMEMDLGYPEKAIQRIDMHTPSITRVIEIANYLGVSIDALTGRETPDFDYAYTEEIITVIWNTICDFLIALHLAVEVKYDVD